MKKIDRSVIQKEVILYGEFRDIELHVTRYRSSVDSPLRGIILYFHGGGFVYGHREDLPSAYIKLLVSAGFELWAFDYPLAPETVFDQIVTVVKQAVDWYVEEACAKYQLTAVPYFVMGRSAGGYLALQASTSLSGRELAQPQGLILFYSFFNLDLPAFHMPSRHYRTYPEVSDAVLEALVGDEPLVAGDQKDRFLIYLAARQRGDWLSQVVGDRDTVQAYSFGKEMIASLPPLFLTAATHDPDVPSQQSRFLSNWHSDAQLHLVEAQGHDFDRTDVLGSGKEVYMQLIRWLRR